MPTPTQIKRNAFARMTLMCQVWTDHREETCKWCGTYKPTLYKYWWEQDHVFKRLTYSSGPFCGISCYHAHTGDEE